MAVVEGLVGEGKHSDAYGGHCNDVEDSDVEFFVFLLSANVLDDVVQDVSQKNCVRYHQASEEVLHKSV